jgi:hypothetical protein
MVFLFGSRWIRNRDLPMLVQRLGDHGVPTASEELGV